MATDLDTPSTPPAPDAAVAPGATEVADRPVASSSPTLPPDPEFTTDPAALKRLAKGARKTSTQRVQELRERRKAKATEPATTAPAAPATTTAEPKPVKPPPPTDTRDDKELARDLGGTLATVFALFGLIARIFGYHWEPMSPEEEFEEGRAWLSLAHRYTWIAWVSSLSAPFRAVRRFMRGLKRIAEADKTEKEKPGRARNLMPVPDPVFVKREGEGS